jgi:hypothetical protein
MFSILNMVIILCIVNHIAACLWFLIAATQAGSDPNQTDMPNWAAPENPNWVTFHGFQDDAWGYQYMTSFHWSITQFTPASMHVQPQNMAERTYANCVIIFALLVFSYLVGSITGSLAQLRSLNDERTKAFWNLRRYLRQNEVPTSLSIRVQKYLEHAWETHKTSKEAMDIKIIRLLSEQLYNELLYSVTAPHMDVHPLFKILNTISEVTMHRLATKAIQRKHIARSDMLFLAQETATHMYFIQTGRLEYTRMRRGKPSHKEIVDAQEDWICEQVLWMPNWVHLGNLVSLSHSVLLLVDAKVFGESIHLNPQVFMLVQSYAIKYLEWINGEDKGVLSDITQGEDMSEQLQGFINTSLYQKQASRAPYLKRKKTTTIGLEWTTRSLNSQEHGLGSNAEK